MADRPDTTLDPEHWDGLRALGHRILDDMFDHLEHIRSRPVWQDMPPEVRARMRAPMPQAPGSLADAYRVLQDTVVPYTVGNPHPGFMGWVHGAGTPIGMIAEMTAGALNVNAGGRNQAPVELEKQVAGWMAGLFGFPEQARGIFVTGTSIANFMGVLTARTARLGQGVRSGGLAPEHGRLRAYTSREAHGCIAKAMDMAGFGTDALRQVAVDRAGRMDLADLRALIAADRATGLQPFLVVATAGTVNTGAIDPLASLADIAAQEDLWLHVDGAYAALGMLAPDVAPLLDGIGRADSIAFDFHKWGQVPYDAGYFMARDGSRMLDAFAAPAAYLQRAGRGLAAGDAWPCDLGPDLSRGFRALKTWLTFQVYGADAIGRTISASCALARRLAARIEAEPELVLAAPVALNVVCFRYVGAGNEPQALDRINREIVLALYDAGRVAPSSTVLDGRYTIRAAIVNHRTGEADIDALVASVLLAGRHFSHPPESPTESPRRMIDPTLIDAAVTPFSPLIGAATLMRSAFRNQDLRPIGEMLLARAQANPGDANAWLDASFVVQLLGQREAGLDVQRQALATNTLYTLPAPAKAPTLNLLVLMGPGDFMANTPVEFLLESTDIAATVQYLSLDLPLPEQVPDHDVLFVAIAQSDANAALLRDVMQLLDGWPRPVVNRPEQIAHLSRDGAYAQLAASRGTLMPQTVRVERADALRVAAGALAPDALLPGAAFPLIVRPLDSHAGTDLERVADAAALQAYLDGQGAPAFYLAPFVDYSGPDGQFRKYRIVLVEGAPYLCHMAVSSHWMVHYLNAGMDESQAKRDEEAREMAAFDAGFAQRHAHALADIDARIGLPYLGIDCAETQDGKLLIFEVDNAMVVHAMDDPARYAYKQPVMARVFAAFAGMLHRAAAR